jgi:transcriptional regulator with XRE-family HTH domain
MINKKIKSNLLVNLGMRLRQIRLHKRLTLVGLSYSSDMETANISRIESGKTNPSYLILYRLCRALGISLEELFKADSFKFDSFYV